MLGGAALTRTYVERDLREVYDGRLFYGKDAFEGLHVMDRLGELKRHAARRTRTGAACSAAATSRVATKAEVDPSTIPDRSPEVETDNEVFVPPFLGSKVVKGIALDDIAAYINETALFRNQWQFRPERPGADGELVVETDEQFKDRIRPTLRALLAECKAEDLLVPQVVYGYFAANGDGNDLVIWTDETRSAELARFSYPRQTKEPYLCIADFFRPVDDGDEVDYAGVPHRHDGRHRVGAHRRAVRGRTSTRTTCCCTASASRWPRRSPSCGTAGSARSGASPRRTGRHSPACSASSTAAVATPGATRPARTSRTT